MQHTLVVLPFLQIAMCCKVGERVKARWEGDNWRWAEIIDIQSDGRCGRYRLVWDHAPGACANAENYAGESGISTIPCWVGRESIKSSNCPQCSSGGNVADNSNAEEDGGEDLNLPLIIGLVVGIAAFCCVCLFACIAKKAASDDEEESTSKFKSFTRSFTRKLTRPSPKAKYEQQSANSTWAEPSAKDANQTKAAKTAKSDPRSRSKDSNMEIQDLTDHSLDFLPPKPSASPRGPTQMQPSAPVPHKSHGSQHRQTNESYYSQAKRHSEEPVVDGPDHRPVSISLGKVVPPKDLLPEERLGLPTSLPGAAVSPQPSPRPDNHHPHQHHHSHKDHHDHQDHHKSGGGGGGHNHHEHHHHHHHQDDKKDHKDSKGHNDHKDHLDHHHHKHEHHADKKHHKDSNH